MKDIDNKLGELENKLRDMPINILSKIIDKIFDDDQLNDLSEDLIKIGNKRLTDRINKTMKEYKRRIKNDD